MIVLKVRISFKITILKLVTIKLQNSNSNYYNDNSKNHSNENAHVDDIVVINILG